MLKLERTALQVMAPEVSAANKLLAEPDAQRRQEAVQFLRELNGGCAPILTVKPRQAQAWGVLFLAEHAVAGAFCLLQPWPAWLSKWGRAVGQVVRCGRGGLPGAAAPEGRGA